MILFGKEVANQIHNQLKQNIQSLPSQPGLALILLGNHPSSQTYVKMKQKACESIGMRSFCHTLPASTSEEELLDHIDNLNQNPTVDGILVQLPLPPSINPIPILEAIDPKKDVDGLHPINLGKLLAGLEDGFIPCTPLGIKKLFEHYNISVEGKHIVIVGRSTIVGKPLAALLMQNKPGCNATVTIVHSRSHHIADLTQQADILIAAVGSPRFVQAHMVKKGAVIIDVGINRENGKLVGDVDFEQVAKKCQAITPVPKGVGPMTVAMLLYNTYLAFQRKSS